VDYETLVRLEREVSDLRSSLGRFRRLGGDTAMDEALLGELELLLAAVRAEKKGLPSAQDE
jgi:hypothetical protein